jgi:hypothetical protein
MFSPSPASFDALGDHVGGRRGRLCSRGGVVGQETDEGRVAAFRPEKQIPITYHLFRR